MAEATKERQVKVRLNEGRAGRYPFGQAFSQKPGQEVTMGEREAANIMVAGQADPVDADGERIKQREIERRQAQFDKAEADRLAKIKRRANGTEGTPEAQGAKEGN